MNQPLGLRTIGRWYKAGALDRRHYEAAKAFHRNPEKWRPLLPLTMWEILAETVSEDRPVEDIERERGWAQRSGKAIVLVLLTMLLEMAAPPDPEEPQ